MHIVSLVDNISHCDMNFEHGLSLYIKLDSGIQILFDTGQSTLFAENATYKDIDLKQIDMAIISHGHYDHGGGLAHFLQLNQKAKIFIRKKAFEPHHSLKETGLKYIGLDTNILLNSKFQERLVFSQEILNISPTLILFSNAKRVHPIPPGNQLLYCQTLHEHDDFTHEQSLIIQEGPHTILFAGCAHAGILNIIDKAEAIACHPVTHVFAGMHLMQRDEESIPQYIQYLSNELKKHSPCQFYTMHCTGETGYHLLKEQLHNQIHYFSCGDEMQL